MIKLTRVAAYMCNQAFRVLAIAFDAIIVLSELTCGASKDVFDLMAWAKPYCGTSNGTTKTLGNRTERFSVVTA
jgi:hypothetical protein